MPKKIKSKPIEACSVLLPDGGILEEIKDYDLGEVYFAYFDGHEVRKVREKEFSGKVYRPINESIVASNAVRFASGVEEYGTTKELRQELQDFIHRHVEVSDFFEKLSSYYVLLSWVYDRFDVSPYLRVIGEPGTGKSRYLQVMGAVCYKPVRVSGVITSASLFRMIDQFHGTLILEEADFQAKSDEYAAMVKILNCGHERGNPVIRQDQVGKRFVSVAYEVFCPKVIATRKRFDDQALESRMLTEKMTRMSRRTEITLNLPAGFDQEALSLRNKLLRFRFRNFHKITPTPIYAMSGIEPRLLHIVSPLLDIMSGEEEERSVLLEWARAYTEDMITERGASLDGDVVHALFDVIDSGGDPQVKNITAKLNEQYEREADKVTAHKVGRILGNLGLNKKKVTRGYIIDMQRSRRTLELLERQYGIEKNITQGGDEERRPVSEKEADFISRWGDSRIKRD